MKLYSVRGGNGNPGGSAAKVAPTLRVGTSDIAGPVAEASSLRQM